jgi:UDP-glucose:glycoprotein glucosyltransferase
VSGAQFDDGLVQLVMVVDPLSAAAQRASTVLRVFNTALGLPVTLLLTPQLDAETAPLKGFYRLVLGSSSSGTSSYDSRAFTRSSSSSGSMVHTDSINSNNNSNSASSATSTWTRELTSATAQFTHLPRRHILTQRVDTPEAFNVQRAVSPTAQDLDNLRCDEGSTGPCGDAGTAVTTARYTVKHLLLAGQCFVAARSSSSSSGASSSGGGSARGLQLVLRSEGSSAGTTSSSTAVVSSDTVVMGNLGYFQLKANPGVWHIELAAGPASDSYELAPTTITTAASSTTGSTAAAAVVPNTQQYTAVVRDFVKRREALTVYKKAGASPSTVKQHQQSTQPTEADAAVTTDSTATGSVYSSLVNTLYGVYNTVYNSASAWLYPGSTSAPASTAGTGTASGGSSVTTTASSSDSSSDSKLETVHVFSLASGHLYERVLKVMMLSVSKRTSGPVKFWLLENYLTEELKSSVLALAAARGFEVAFVSYKWPEWLPHQTEQQRIIWGYKILFLDVLFPLDVRKFIYVDADQVVRADLRELWDMDLQEKPYAFTPFCDSRQETLSYQVSYQISFSVLCAPVCASESLCHLQQLLMM